MMLSALFEPEPEQWGLRGDPIVWRGMRDGLTDVPVPHEATAVDALLRRAFHDIVGVYPDEQPDKDSVFRPELDQGGMSGGHVHLPTWQHRLLVLLASRARKATAGLGWAGDPDDTALLRIAR